jgi:hypothetical protein
MSESSRSQAARDGNVVEEIRCAYETGTEQKNDAAA